MSAYNCMRIDFIDGNSQYRFYKNPVTKKEYLLGEESVIESERIDEKIEKHVPTPFGGCADIDDNAFKVLSPIEIAMRRQRSVVNSVNRTKGMIYNYARGNVWEWFITLTFSKDKVDRYDYEQCSKKLRQWLNNMRKKYAIDLKYLVVPEQHKDGAWHFHGLLSNTGNMVFKEAKNKHTGSLLKTKNDLQIYNFGNYKLGYSTATPIVDTSKASSYITKYITKELSVNTKGFRRYYPSANLDLPPKSFFYILYQDKIDFLIKNSKRISYMKNVKVSCGTFKNIIDYIEIGGNENEL